MHANYDISMQIKYNLLFVEMQFEYNSLKLKLT